MMAKRIAQFHKVSFEQFAEGFQDTFGEMKEGELKEIYQSIKLPKRATAGSAGYDFYTPIPIVLAPGKTVKIPTGIRVEMQENWVLKCYPRSGLGFKYRLQLNNTVGIIDSDYFYSDNEGHIFAKLTNDSNEGKTVELEAGSGFMQGIFVEYGITMDDDVTTVRNGRLEIIPEIIRRITEKCQGIKYDTASFRHTIIIDFDLLLLFKIYRLTDETTKRKCK